MKTIKNINLDSFYPAMTKMDTEYGRNPELVFPNKEFLSASAKYMIMSSEEARTWLANVLEKGRRV